MSIKHFNLVVNLILIPVLVLSKYMSSRFKFLILMSSIMMFGSPLLPFVLQGVHVIFMFSVFIYLCWCPPLFLYQIISVSSNSETKGATSGAGTAYPSEAHEFILKFLVGSSGSIFSFLCSVLQIKIFLLFSLELCANWRSSKYQFYDAFRFMRSPPSGLRHNIPTKQIENIFMGDQNKYVIKLLRDDYLLQNSFQLDKFKRANK